MFSCHFLFILAQDKSLKYPIFFGKIGLNNINILGVAIIAKLSQVVTVNHLVSILFDNVFMGVIQRGGKFQQQIIFILFEDTLNRPFPV